MALQEQKTSIILTILSWGGGITGGHTVFYTHFTLTADIFGQVDQPEWLRVRTPV